ncbi:MAG: IS1182 family transposase [Candidatus Woesearchaeota archaeon]
MSCRRPHHDQELLFYQTVDEKVKKSPHAARFFKYIADHLYIPFYKQKQEGTPPFDRPTMVALILFGFFKGNFSRDAIVDMHKDSLGANWLLKGMTIPAGRTVGRIIKDIMDNIDLIFMQIYDLCLNFNLIGGERAFIDGTKSKANASKHKAMSYKRLEKKVKKNKETIKDLINDFVGYLDNYKELKDDEFKNLITSAAKDVHKKAKALHQKQLNTKKEVIFSGQKNTSKKEPEVHKNQQKFFEMINDDENIDEVKEALNDIGFKLSRQENMENAKQELETVWKEENGSKEPVPDDKQINFTDSESKIMPTKHHGIQQCYNNFAMVDEKANIIIGAYTSNTPNDKQALIPTIEDAKNCFGPLNGVELGVDCGFYSADNIEYCKKEEIDYFFSIPESESAYGKDKFEYDEKNDVYICPEGNKLYPPERKHKDAKTRCYKTSDCLDCPVGNKCTKAKDGIRKIIRNLKKDPIQEQAEQKSNTKKGKEILKQRKSVSEPVWGNMRRKDNLIQLHYRGLDNAGKEFKLRAIMQNLRKLFKVFANNPQARHKIENMGSNSYEDVV